MYKIVLDTGELLGYTNNIRWIKKHTNGCYVQCPENEAVGVAFKSIPYSLSTNEPLDGAAGTVYVFYGEDDDVLLEHSHEIADTQNAICEQSTLLESALADAENALCELSEQLNN